MSSLQRVCASAAVALTVLVSSAPATAQATSDGYRNAHRLGGSTSLRYTEAIATLDASVPTTWP